MIEYGKILKQAYAILQAHKFLWALGLFLVWGEVFNFLGLITNRDQYTLQLRDFAQTHSSAFVVVAMVLIALFLMLLIWFFRGKAALIGGTKDILDKKPIGFRKSISESKKFYTRLFGIWFSTVFLLTIATVILATPVVYLISINYASRAIALGALAFAIFLPLSVLVNLLSNLSPMYVVFYNMPIGRAISSAFNMCRKLWPTLVVFSVILGLLTMLATSALLLIWGLGVEILSQLFYNTGGFVHTIGYGLSGVFAIIAFLIFAGFITAYQQIAWVLAFNELVKPIKLEEGEVVPVPEIV